MSNKMWDVLVEHAKTCVLSGKHYVYYAEDERNVGVVFNNIYEFCGLISSGQYYSADSLSESQKVIVYLQSHINLDDHVGLRSILPLTNVTFRHHITLIFTAP
jgi:hypothetical protein